MMDDDDTWCDGIQCDDIIQWLDDDLCQWECSTQTLDGYPSASLHHASSPLQSLRHDIVRMHRHFPSNNSFPLLATDGHCADEKTCQTSNVETMNASACAQLDTCPSQPPTVPTEVTETNFIERIYQHLYGSTPSDGPMHLTDSTQLLSFHPNMDEQDCLRQAQPSPPQRSPISEMCNGMSALNVPSMDGALVVGQSNPLCERLCSGTTRPLSPTLPTRGVPRHLSSIGHETPAVKSGCGVHESQHLLMCQPLTAYNYFYRNERDTIIQGMTCADDPIPGSVWDFSAEKKEQLLRQHWYDY
jgi:hypothetical protein